ncbi:MAG: RIP metalloprotease RseP [Rickettsiales bacterium]|nr:RIP metalloprotease RseP [Rickettsiales bacterium]
MDFLLILSNYFEYIFWFVIVFTIIVFVHEFGHYYVARLNNVQIEKFSIGFGPVLLSKVDKHKTKWQICAFPLGGYVKFFGEMYPDKSNESDIHNKKLFMNKKALQKASIVLAGPLANFLLSLVLFILIFSFFGKNFTSPIIGDIKKNSPAEQSGLLKGDRIISINSINIEGFDDYYEISDGELLEKIDITILRNDKKYNIDIVPQHKLIKTFIGTDKYINYIGIRPIIEPVVGKVIKNSPAYFAGLLYKDKIIKINNNDIYDANEVIKIIKVNANKKIDLSIIRDNKVINLSLIPKEVSEKKIGQIGITFNKNRQKLNFYNSFILAANSIYEVTVKTLIAFYEIIFGKRDHCEVGGPILIAKVSNDVANTDMVSFVALIALISVNLGLINLFPLPLLDGGHFFTYISEFIIGKNINYNFFKFIQILGVIIIISFMSFSILNDIYCRILN